MFLKKLIKVFCLFVIGQLLYAKHALAWGPGVHTVIALNMIENVHILLPAIAGIISSFPLEYMYGCLAADFFMGKRRMKKAGRTHNWEGGFRFLDQAGTDQEAACAYGFLSHLAADVVAHNFFVPNVTRESRALRKKSHLYWEFKADYRVGHMYTKIARDVLGRDHRECDRVLEIISGKKEKGLQARKLIFTESVKISDLAYSTHHLFYSDWAAERRGRDKYMLFMIGLSSQAVGDFLKDPERSPCLAHNPIGQGDSGAGPLRMSLTDYFRSPYWGSPYIVHTGP